MPTVWRNACTAKWEIRKFLWLFQLSSMQVYDSVILSSDTLRVMRVSIWSIYIQLGEWHVNNPQKAKQDSLLVPLMNSNPSQRIENSQDRQESGTDPWSSINIAHILTYLLPLATSAYSALPILTNWSISILQMDSLLSTQIRIHPIQDDQTQNL